MSKFISIVIFSLVTKAFHDEYEETDVSVEGQADYFAFRYCLARIFKRLPPVGPVKPLNAYTGGA